MVLLFSITTLLRNLIIILSSNILLYQLANGGTCGDDVGNAMLPLSRGLVWSKDLVIAIGGDGGIRRIMKVRRY